MNRRATGGLAALPLRDLGKLQRPIVGSFQRAWSVCIKTFAQTDDLSMAGTSFPCTSLTLDR